MKKIALFTIVLSLFLTSCEKKGDVCKINYPNNVKDIDWNNYNDVYTVHWNYHSECGKVKNDDNGKEIMVYGILSPEYVQSAEFLYLTDCINDLKPIIIIETRRVFENDSLFYQVQAKLDTSDLTKKCFIKGEIYLFDFHTNDCCWSRPIILLTNVNNIFFK